MEEQETFLDDLDEEEVEERENTDLLTFPA